MDTLTPSGTSSTSGSSISISRSSLIDRPISLKLSSLSGEPPFALSQDIYAKICLWQNNKPLLLPITTAHKNFKPAPEGINGLDTPSHQGGIPLGNHASSSKVRLASASRNKGKDPLPHVSYTFNETFSLPVKYRDLAPSAQLTFTLYDAPPSTSSDPLPRIIGGTTLPLFSASKGTLKKGRQRCLIYKEKAADGKERTTTNGKVKLDSLGSNTAALAAVRGVNVPNGVPLLNGDSTPIDATIEGDEMGRLEKLVKKHERGDLVRMDWLDKIAFREIEKVHAAASALSSHLFLYVELPLPSFPIVFSSLSPALPNPSAAGIPLGAGGQLGGLPSQLQLPGYDLCDPDSNTAVRENPIEAKHRVLVRRSGGRGRLGGLDKEAKPERGARDELTRILSLPPTAPLSSASLDLLWQYRFWLSQTHPHALPKFLRSVSWTDPVEVQQATEVLLPNWVDGGGGVEEALEVLGPGVGEAGREPRVRDWAVSRMGKKADDDELSIYLLQLVQALKFEPAPQTPLPHGSSPSSSRHARSARSVLSLHPHHGASSHYQSSQNQTQTLESFLIERACKSPKLASQMFWYLTVETSDRRSGAMYTRILNDFLTRLPDDKREILKRQSAFVDRLSTLAKDVRANKEARPKKIERMRKEVSDPKGSLAKFDPLPLPLDANVTVTGIQAENSTIFKSNLFPLRLCLICQPPTPSSSNLDLAASSNGDSNIVGYTSETSTITSASEVSGRPSTPTPEVFYYNIIFKNGDDLRQDQLVIQLFTLMDRLLRKENLDLKLMPYKVLATGPIDGMVQFVESKSIGEINSTYGAAGLQAYLKQNKQADIALGTYGIDPTILDTFVKSCAGYCVVTYLLGVGDRHLDNLLVSPDGHFLHVDFGYILGRDPKPFAPQVKLSKEMVDTMGGANSEHFSRFKHLCYTAFISLRKNASLILNLVAMCLDANIPDIRLEPDKAVSKVQDKFCLHFSEEDAIKHFETLLNEGSYITDLMDKFHSAAQFFRS